tara:strand:- start:2315 stop:3544 length:1230 start_codon:yes stop_codon:yes gene_type:complete
VELDINQTIQQAFTAHKEGKLEEAEKLYCEILKNQPRNIKIHNNLGSIFKRLGKFKDAEKCYKDAIALEPNFVDSYINLGNIKKDLDKLDDAEFYYKKTIEIKPDYAEAHNYLGLVFVKIQKLDEAETCFKKAIKLLPNYAEAFYNLGCLFNESSRIDDAKVNYRKAIELKPDYVEAHNNLGIILRENKLTTIINEIKTDQKNKANFIKKACIKFFNINYNFNKLGYGTRLTSNPFISDRKVDSELLTHLYKLNTTKLDENVADIDHLRYGNGRCSDYGLFENNSIIIKDVAKDLTRIMMQAVKSKIFIMESFFNIFQTGSGITTHHHVNNFDMTSMLVNQKFSLTYYLDIGDQNCSEPGILKFYNPTKEILPSKGQIIIFPADQKHSAVYNGKTDRVMMGVNFYSLLR